MPSLQIPVIFPEGEVRYFGGKHPVKILPESEYQNCVMKYSKFNTPTRDFTKDTYPCLILNDFKTGMSSKGKKDGIEFKKDEKVLLNKKFLFKKPRSEWKGGEQK
jgi:hypothetical protein